MRKVGALNLPNFTREDEQPVKRRRRRRRSYFCSYCGYESTRQYNVTRHEERIHTIIPEPRTCCGTVFPTKGEYYLHCEHFHPEKRSNAIVSRIKYKILADMIRIRRSRGQGRRRRRRRTLDDEDEMEDEDEWDKEEEEEENGGNRRTVKENRTYVLRRRYSERIRQKNTETRTKSELTFQCSITYSELDRENIPLACLLNDRALRKARYSATPVVVNPLARTPACNDAKRSTKKLDDPCESISDTMMTKRATISNEKRSCKENEEREYSRNEEDNSSILETSESSSRWTSLSESSSSSFVGELPTKKLILRRFMTTMNIEIEKMSQQRTKSMPLQERNSNVSVASQSKRLIKSCKRSFVSSSSSSSYSVLDKENIPNLGRDLEEKVKVRLDSSIALPFVTKLHREFLSSVDFDSL